MSEQLPAARPRKRIEITEDSLGDVARAPVASAAAVPAAPVATAVALPAVTIPKISPARLAPRGSAFCSACGNAIDERAAICPQCGVATPRGPMSGGLTAHQAVALSMNQKSPGVAVLLSLLWTGAGQIYCGRAGRGLAFMAAAFVSAVLILMIVGLILLPIVWIWAAVDAHSLAQRQNTMLLSSMST